MADLAASNFKGAIRVLHVDDDSSLLEISKQILVDIDSSFEIDHACCVDEAFKKLETGHYDVVISDYEMPQKSGLQFLKELREQKNNIPFVLFTGKGREEVAVEALNLGADGYINKQGDPETVYGELTHTLLSLVEKSKTKQALEESEKRFHTLMEQASEAIFIHDTHGRLKDVNQRACKDLGYTKEELIKMTIADIDGEATDKQKGLMWPKVVGGETFVFESSHKRKDGSIFPVEVSLGSIAVDNEILVIGLIRDTTERKKVEEALVNSESHYRLLADNVHDVIWTMDLEGHFTYVSPSVLQLSGYTPDEVLKQSMVEVLTPDSARIVLEDLSRFLETGAVPLNYYELEQPCKDGSTVWTEVNFTVLRNRDGNPEAFLGVSRNIAERKKAEKASLESEAKFRLYIENSPVAVFVANQEGKYEYVNEAATSLLGYSKAELLQMSIPQVAFSGDLKNFDEVKKAGRSVGEKVLRSKTGLPIYVILNSAKLPDGKFMAFCENITERKKAEESLRKSEERYRGLADSLPEIVFEADDKGVPTFLNKKASEIMGYFNDEIKQMNILQFLVPEDRQRAKENIQRRMKGEKSVGNEYTLLRKDGTTFPGMIFTEEGESLGLRGVIVNISQTKKATEEMKRLNEKLRVVGGLTRHDVRNKLSAVSGYAYLLKKKHADQADIVEGLCKMEQAVKDSMKIVEFAKMYEQIGVEELTYIDVEKRVNEAIALFSGFNLKVVNDCQNLSLLADSFLRQLFYNFIDNTRKYGKKTTTIRVHYEKAESGELRLIYEDDGVGISAENKSKLFSEGFSTGGSTGFGLFLIKKMIDVYGWQIQETGEPGKGAKFVVTIPKLNKNGKENYQTA